MPPPRASTCNVSSPIRSTCPGTRPGSNSARAASNASGRRAAKSGSPTYATAIQSKIACIRLTGWKRFMDYSARFRTRWKMCG